MIVIFLENQLKLKTKKAPFHWKKENNELFLQLIYRKKSFRFTSHR
jgi:hypothetical protein